jgi:mono/diheme cytochrome c family protein
MMRRTIVRWMLPTLALFAVTGLYAGGWAIVTLTEFPDHATAGKPLNLSFAVRQHGVTLLSGLHPAIRATNGTGAVVDSGAKATRTPGEYSAALTLPEPGEWKITIASGFMDNAITLPTLKVTADGSPAPVAFSPATRGLRLFTAKGCVGCHRHIEVNPERTGDPKFDLTSKRFSPAYLKKFLKDPSIKTTNMPNLKLTDQEIDALAAFLEKGSEKQAAR